MELEEYQRLDEVARASIEPDTYLSLARNAARRLLENKQLDVCHVYLSNRFGEFVLDAYITDTQYAEIGAGWEKIQEKFYGFRLSVQPIRRMVPGLEEYDGSYFFSKERDA